jgi:hypothetical protein
VSWGAGSKEIFLTAPANIFDSGLLWEYEVTGAAETSIDTGSILDINTHKSYRIEIDWYNSSGTSYAARLFVNGDTTVTNYDSQYLYANHTTITGARENNANLLSALNGHSISAVIHVGMVAGSGSNNYARITNSGAPASAGSSIDLLLRTVAYRTSITNITQLTFSPTGASAIGVGTKIRIYRGDR